MRNNPPDLLKAQIEREAWHTSRRENEKNYELVSTPLKWAGILTYVIDYQNKHHGLSPTDLMIAKGTMLSAGQVQYHMREMEKADLIKDNKGWPRRISIENVTKVAHLTAMDSYQPKEEKVQEAAKMDTSQLETRRTGRGGYRISVSGKKPFLTRAKEVAQAIIDHYDMYGKSPKVGWINKRVWRNEYGAMSGGSASRVIKMMAELGWVTHRPRHNDICLTGHGRAAMFGEVGETLHTDTPVNPEREIPVVRQTFSRAAPPPLNMAPQPSIPRPVPQVEWPPEPPVSEEVRSELMGLSLKGVSDIDLIIELNRRGIKITR